MKTFKFYQDIKVTVWDRQFFEIEAENEQKAKRIAMKFLNQDVSAYDEFKYSEILTDTEERMTVEDNNGYDTVELYLKGEEKPFATNGKDENKHSIGCFDEFKDAHQVAYGLMEGHTGLTTDNCALKTYYAYQADEKLHIIVLADDGTAEQYIFSENWDNLVNNNEAFRKAMADYLLKQNGNNENTVAEIHDWLTGHLTEIECTTNYVNNRVPFGLHELVSVWKHKAACRHIEAASLIGFQVMDDEGEFPEGLFSFQIIKGKQKALDILSEAQKTQPGLNFNLYPIYEGEIEEFSFI